MEYYGNNDFRDYRNGAYLAHYGRKGMKWGKHLSGTDWWKDVQPGPNGMIDPQQVKVAQAQAMYAQQRMQNARANEAAARNAADIAAQRAENAKQIQSADSKANGGIASKQDAYAQAALSANKAAEEAAKGQANATPSEAAKKEKEKKETEKKIDDIVDKVINGNYGNGEERKKALAKEGYDYAEVQNKVNERLGSSKRHESEKTKESSEAKTETSSQSSNTMSAAEHAGRTAEAAARSGTTAKADAKKKQIQDRANEATARAKQERKRQKKQKKASAKRVKRVKKKAADISAKNERYARIGKNQVVLEPDKKNYMLKM